MTSSESVLGKKAKEQAERAGPALFSGAAALREVAKADGRWNWVLVGPDPELLPLFGGGHGGVKELGEALGSHPRCFGLLRLTFGLGPHAAVKFAFIHTADAVDEEADAVAPKMEAAIGRFCTCMVKLCCSGSQDCTAVSIVNKLHDAAPEAERATVTMANFSIAEDQYKLRHPHVEEQERQARVVERLELPRAEVAEPELEAPLPSKSSASRLRKKVKLYSKGDQVEVFSMKRMRWMPDGEVVHVVRDACIVSGVAVAAGSMKVVFGSGKLYKWVAPGDMDMQLRPSARPKPPPPRTGALLVEGTSWFEWYTWRYLELSRGFLRWWDTEEEAKSGKAARGSVFLLGLQQHSSGVDFTVRTCSSGGTVHRFRATREDAAKSWTRALWAHAGYCQNVRELDEGLPGPKE